ncbi:hypothetical protein Pfo_004352 [Paulownia fortunei]|nr:hypothetical protein Pfo_004352 [Paulownia fortunei]
MCSDIHHFSSFGMSTCNSPQNCLLEEKEEQEGIIKLENSSQPTSENPSSCQEIASEFQETLDRTDHEEEEDSNTSIKDGEKNVEATVSSRESEKPIPEDDDGFRTPTSLDHKIPAITQCPPAPKKTRPQPSKLKRQASPASRRSLQFDASAEFESIFLPMTREYVEEKKSKKARRDDEI